MEYPSEMSEGPVEPEGQDALEHALSEVLEANRALQAVLEESAARTKWYIQRLRTGERVVDLARALPVEKDRTEDNEAIDRFTRARLRSRAATFQRLADEGMSRKEIAGLWGFSQQVVSRIINHKGVLVQKGASVTEIPADGTTPTSGRA